MKKLLLFITSCLLLLLPVSADYDNKYQDISDLIDTNYYGQVDKKEMEDALYRGMLEALDPYSVYFSVEELKQFEESITGSYVGIGVSVQESNDYIKIISVFEDSPAERAGLEANDYIIAVAGESIEGKALETVIPKIKGAEGTTVNLTIARDGKGEFDVDVLREHIEMKTVTHKEVDGYDIFAISSFSEHTAEDLKTLLAENIIQKGIIIDLRDNPGGSLDSVVEIADIFLEKGKSITTIDYGKDQTASYLAKTMGRNEKMAVLINENSASASELFAGAMQDNGRAIVIGTTSYGKGSVQSLYYLKDGSALKLTIAKYQTPSGKYIHEIGIKPDIELKDEQMVDPLVTKFQPMNSLSTSNLGSRDIDTMGMQQRLNYMNYPLIIDGSFGLESCKALKKFESDNNLVVDGILDIDTKNALEQQFLKVAKTQYDAVLLQAIDYLNMH